MTSTTLSTSNRTPLPGGVLSYEEEKQKTSASSATLGQAEFLKLMTAQLKNQDPMQPMENGEFLGQMAQFSTVSSMSEMLTELKSLTSQMAAGRLLSSGSLIGRSVLAEGSFGALPAEGTLDGSVRLTEPADETIIDIRDATGQVVDSMKLGPAGSGDYPFSWDGATSDGQYAPPGRYQIDVAVTRAGKTSAVKPMLYVPIGSVSMSGQNVMLNLLSGTQMPLDQVTTIR
jgi:flagellar basal-body rod modification protein FlgD